MKQTIENFLVEALQGAKVKVKLLQPFPGTSLLKSGDIVEAYIGHDGTGKPCLRVADNTGTLGHHWIITDETAEIVP